jgi:hypothetical protein
MANHVQTLPSLRRIHGVTLAFSALFLVISSAIGCAEDPGPGPIPLDELRGELSTALCNQVILA